MTRHKLYAFLCVAALAIGGCGDMQSTQPPKDMASLQKMPPPGQAGSYAPHTIILFNLQRVLDKDRAAADRMESMKVVAKVGGDDASIRGDLARRWD